MEGTVVLRSTKSAADKVEEGEQIWCVCVCLHIEMANKTTCYRRDHPPFQCEASVERTVQLR